MRRRLFPIAFLAVFTIYFQTPSLATDSLGRVNFITKLPFALFLVVKESQTANVWIPESPPPEKDRDGSVTDEYAEVATVFAKPEAKLVQTDSLPSEQAVPWTSLKQEWELYKKFHENKNRRQSGAENSDEQSAEEEDEEEEDEEPKLPQAFYGQQNSDDDEKDFLQKQQDSYKKKKKVVEEASDEEDEDEEEEDGGAEYSDIQGLENLSHDEKQAIIDKIFTDAQKQYDNPPSTDVVVPEKVEDSDEDEVQADIETKKKKGEEQDDDDGHGKKDKKKKKKKKKKKGKKKGGNGWGWKKPIVIPIEAPKDEGWGWKKHDGLLEQLVKGSTWERVLSYYHSHNDKKGDSGGWGWGEEKEKPDLATSIHNGGEKLITKLFKGSFWDRAFQTYSQYKKNNYGKPTKEYEGDVPLTIDW